MQSPLHEQAGSKLKATPESRSLLLSEWPDADRAAWATARTTGMRLGPRGVASHLEEETCSDLIRRYGQFLHFCQRTSQLSEYDGAAGLVTPCAIRAFIIELQARVGSVTVAGTVRKVHRTATLLSPARDFLWLGEMAGDLELVAVPTDKSSRVVLTERLVEAGLTLVKEADLALTRPLLDRAVGARNGLMIAILALCPIRLRNFSSLELDNSFVKHGSCWWILLSKTKSRRPDERPVPTFVSETIERYLEVYRPALLGEVGQTLNYGARERATSKGLWIGRYGQTLGYSGVASCITKSTHRTIGVPISPHLFRAAAATTAALYVTAMPHLGSAILQHTDPAITNESYNRASSLTAAVEFQALVHNFGRPRQT